MRAVRHLRLAFAATPLAWLFVLAPAALAALWLFACPQLAPSFGWLLGSLAWTLVVLVLGVAPLVRLTGHTLAVGLFAAAVIAIAIECAIAARTTTSHAWLWHFVLFSLTSLPTALASRSCDRCKRTFSLRGLVFKGERRTTYSADANGHPLTVLIQEGTDLSACAYCGAPAKRAVKRELPLVLLIAVFVVAWPFLLWRSFHTRLVPR